MGEKCFYCDKPAVRWCDFQVGHPIGGYVRVGKVAQNRFHAVIDVEKLPHTCDMPMCEDHCTQVGRFHVSGKDSFTETIDHCPEHVGKDDANRMPCTEEEAASLRREIRAQARRKAIALA